MDETDKENFTNSVELRKNNFMRVSRRSFLKMGALTAGALSLGSLRMIDEALASTQVPQTPLLATTIPKYVDPLPVFGPAGGITVPGFTGQPGSFPFNVPRVSAPSINVSMEIHKQQVLSTGTPLAAGAANLTNLWAYNINNVKFYPARTVEVTKGTPTQMIYDNKLNADLYKTLTVDQTLHRADTDGNGMTMLPYSGSYVPTVVHLHGGEVPATIDGGPDAWFTNQPLDPVTGVPVPAPHPQGPSYYSDPGASATGATYTYPNVQESTTLFFHDHALGATRLNVHAGLAAFYFIRDNLEAAVAPPLPTGPYEIEIAIQDRMFDDKGQLLFPDVGVNPEHPFWVPEFFGDAIVVNGKTWPYLNVEPRRYRLRFVNGSNARFYNLRSKVDFWQIGTDGGLLDFPVKVNNLLLAPGERADVIVDFFKLSDQTKIIKVVVNNNAATPYPAGLPVVRGTTDQILEFRIGTAPKKVPANWDTTFDPSKKTALRTGTNVIVRLVNPTTGVLTPGVVPTVKRSLTLNEWLNPLSPGGIPMPLEMLLNNTKWDGMQYDTRNTPATLIGLLPGSTQINPGPNPGPYSTENVTEGTTEIWEIVNLTVDAHPMHLHLVQFQLMNRQVLDAVGYQAAYDAAFAAKVLGATAWIPEYGPPNAYGTPNADGYIGGNPAVSPFLNTAGVASPILPPNQNERGWKDTVVCLPGQVTRIALRFAPLDKPIAGPNLYYPFNPSPAGSHGYVWHCHIIDHEDNEMMRPYFVTPATTAAPTVGITNTLPGGVNVAITLTGTPTYAPGLTGTIAWAVTDPVGAAVVVTSGLLNTASFTPLSAGTYNVTATVTDSRGNTGTTTISITV
ncbi:MAG: multicopper oxidase domain-containing protein [Candidatus Methanoperedens sp.]|nr:multicopper oxidase domain-containing protein [Candidatus Methanoperedens sp.]